MMPQGDIIPDVVDNSGILYRQEQPQQLTPGQRAWSWIKDRFSGLETAIYDRLAQHGQMRMQRELAPARMIIPTQSGCLTPEQYRENDGYEGSTSGVFSRIRGIGGNRRLFTLGGAVLAGAMAGLALMPAAASADGQTLEMIGGANGAHLYLSGVEPGQPTTIYMLPSPFAVPQLSDVVKILPAGVTYAEIQNNWFNKSEDTGACWFVAAQQPGGDSESFSNRLGRATPWYLFDNQAPNESPNFYQMFAEFTAGLDSIILIPNSSGNIEYPLGQHIEDATHRLHDVQAAGAPANQSTYWNSFGINNRVIQGSPKAAGFAGILPAVLTNPYGASPTKDLVMMVAVNANGRIKQMFNNNPETNGLEGAIVSFTNLSNGNVLSDTTNANGAYNKVIPWGGQTLFTVSHLTTDILVDTLNITGNFNEEVYMHPKVINQQVLHDANKADRWYFQFPILYYVGNQPAKEPAIINIIDDLFAGGNLIVSDYIDTTHTQVPTPSWPYQEQKGINVDYGSSFGNNYVANTSHIIVYGFNRFGATADISQGNAYNAAQEEINAVLGAFNDISQSGFLLSMGDGYSVTQAERIMLQTKLWLAKIRADSDWARFEKFIDAD